MAIYRDTVICKDGNGLLRKVIQGLATIRFTSVKTSSTEYTAEDLPDLTGIGDIVQETALSASAVEGTETMSLYAAFGNRDLSKGYYVRNFGVYAQDPDDGTKEILYAVVNADESTTPAAYLPAYAGKGTGGIEFECAVTVGNADSVTVVLDPDAGVPAALFERLVEKVDTHIDKRVYSNDGAHSIRYKDGKLQVYDNDGGRWIDAAGGGPGDDEASAAEVQDIIDGTWNEEDWDDSDDTGQIDDDGSVITEATDDEIEDLNNSYWND